MVDRKNTGSILLDNEEVIKFAEIGNINPKLLTSNGTKREEYAKAMFTPKINSYTSLVEFTQAELKRLKSPFTFFAGDKIKAINTALLRAEDMSANDELKQSYKDLARASGLD